MPVSRRALLGATAAFAPAAAAVEPLKLPGKVRLGILDVLGHLGDVTSHLKDAPDVEVVAVAVPDAADFNKLSRNPRVKGAKHYADWRRMLDTEKLDMVAVCNANGPRAEAILACLDRKLHVIAEKPLGLTRGDLNKIKQKLDSSGVKLSTILPMRFTGPYLALKQIAASGAIGEVINITTQKSYKAGDRPAWMKNQKTYGGTIPWIGIHMIDLMRFCSGRECTEAFSYRAQVKAPAGIGEMENTTGTIFRLDNQGVGTLHMDYCRPESSPTHGDDRLRMAGTKGVAEYMAATGVTLLEEGKKPEVVTKLPTEGSVFLDFLEHVYHGKPTALTFRDIYQANLITIAAQESAVSGKPVKV